MKKDILVLLAILLLTGCAAPKQPAPETTATYADTTAGTLSTEATTQVIVPTEKEETPTPTDAPQQEESEAPIESEKTPVPETNVEQTPPAKDPEPAPTPPVQPSTPGRKVSSATCKDTGSSKLWIDPNANAPDYYEETDPERPEYVQALITEGNPYFFWLIEESMRMYVGRTYGIPLYTGYEVLLQCTWTSSDPSVATVNQYGFVVPLKPGNVVVTIACTDPETGEVTSRRCRIFVEEEPAPKTMAELEALAKVKAKEIADQIMNNPNLKTDLERIAMAAQIVNNYVGKGTYDSSIAGYNQPFGTLITLRSSCAGSTRATGLVLEYMGFEWYHVNENQWDHQWCLVYDVDGQTAFADGSVLGIAGYGDRQEDGSNWMQYQNGALKPV